MTKRTMNARLDEDLLAAFDVWAEEQGWSRTRALERVMASTVADGLPAGDDTRKPPSSEGHEVR